MKEDPELLAFLADPTTYGEDSVESIVTHASRVFLAGDRAYKLKRPVSFPFMDYSTLAKRDESVHEELAINRRTAPDLYLHATAVVKSGTRWRLTQQLAPDDEVVDWLVVMRRFEQACLYSAIAERGELRDVHVDSLRDAMLDLHQKTPSSAVAWRDAMDWVVKDNCDELTTFAPVFEDQDVLHRVIELTQTQFHVNQDLLNKRAEQRWVKRCHGDLHLGNVAYLDARAVLFDAVEFNPRLATIDVLYDSAFVLMDLMARGFPEQAFRLMNGIMDRSSDEPGLALLPLYLATRALIRAKVTASVAADDSSAEARQTATHYLEQAVPYLEAASPTLIAIGGLSGTGKSTVARAIGPHLGPPPGARWIRSDVIRKLQAGVSEMTTLADSQYGPGSSRPVYDEMGARARRALGAGRSVIIDAVFARPEERERMSELASQLGIPFIGVWLDGDLELRRQRVSRRRGDVSDADVRVVHEQEELDPGPITWHRVPAGDNTLAEVQAVIRTVR
ncbi:MAG: AAA family ATPase [Myxococcota bacterium]